MSIPKSREQFSCYYSIHRHGFLCIRRKITLKTLGIDLKCSIIYLHCISLHKIRKYVNIFLLFNRYLTRVMGNTSTSHLDNNDSAFLTLILSIIQVSPFTRFKKNATRIPPFVIKSCHDAL